MDKSILETLDNIWNLSDHLIIDYEQSIRSCSNEDGEIDLSKFDDVGFKRLLYVYRNNVIYNIESIKKLIGT